MASENPNLMITEYDAVSGKTIVRDMTANEQSQYQIDKQRFFDDLWNQLRRGRNELLAASDWTHIEDSPVDKALWAEYRQALRDLPENTIDPENPVWPTPPA
jgi:hypothetical protein